MNVPQGSNVSTALTTMKNNMAEYKVGDVRHSALRLNNDWITFSDYSTTDPYRLANNTYDPTIHTQLFDALMDNATALKPILYTTTKKIVSQYSGPMSGQYNLSKLYYLNGNKILLYYNYNTTDSSKSCWCIRKYKIETTKDDLDPVNSSNYVEYPISEATSYYATTLSNHGYSGDTEQYLVYVNGIYFLKLYNYSSGTNNITNFFKYSYDLQTWYDYSENGSSCGNTNGWIYKKLPKYCNGYYYYTENLNIHYKTSLTANYTTVALNVPANGYILSPIYYKNNKYYMLIAYNTINSTACNIYLYESSNIYNGYTTNYNTSIINEFHQYSGNFSMTDRTVLANDAWIINFDNIWSNTVHYVCIYDFNLSTCINKYRSDSMNANKCYLRQVTDKYIIYSTIWYQSSSSYPIGCIIVKLDNFNIKCYSNVSNMSELCDANFIICNNSYILMETIRSNNDIALTPYSCAFPTFTNSNDWFYVKGK